MTAGEARTRRLVYAMDLGQPGPGERAQGRKSRRPKTRLPAGRHPGLGRGASRSPLGADLSSRVRKSSNAPMATPGPSASPARLGSRVRAPRRYGRPPRGPARGRPSRCGCGEPWSELVRARVGPFEDHCIGLQLADQQPVQLEATTMARRQHSEAQLVEETGGILATRDTLAPIRGLACRSGRRVWRRDRERQRPVLGDPDQQHPEVTIHPPIGIVGLGQGISPGLPGPAACEQARLGGVA